MKKILMLFVAVFAVISISTAQNSDFKAAKKAMKKIERQTIKQGTDAEGIALINAAKEARVATKEYLKSADGFAEISNDKRAKKQFSKQLRKEDPNYADQLKQTKILRKDKVAYFASINTEYKAAADLLATKKKKRSRKRQ